MGIHLSGMHRFPVSTFLVMAVFPINDWFKPVYANSTFQTWIERALFGDQVHVAYRALTKRLSANSL
jgi:hypothetical protein